MFNITNVDEPLTLTDALYLLSNEPNKKIIAGGTDVLVRLHHGQIENVELVSLRKIQGLNEITHLDDGSISIGAMANFSQIHRSDLIKQFLPILGEASVSMGGPQIRNMATIGGNICNGAVSADSAPALFCLNAILKLESINNTRFVPIQEFYEGPGKVRLLQGEILTSIIITKENYENMLGKYIKFSNRKAMDIAMLSVAVVVFVNEDKFSDLRISLGVAAPTPIRCIEAEQYAIGKNVSTDTIKNISKLALTSSKPRDSWRGSKTFREHLIVVLVERAIKESLNKLGVVYDD